MIPEAPTEAEVKGLLERMDSVMISHQRSNAIERFEIVWQDKAYDYAFELDGLGLRMSKLIEAPPGYDTPYIWSHV